MSKTNSPTAETPELSGFRDSPLFGTDIGEAKQPSYIAFSHRDPFARDAYKLGFMPGVRENQYTYQISNKPNVNYPVYFLDNDHENPDIDRFIRHFKQYRPEVAVLGDARTRRHAKELVEVAKELLATHDFVPIIAPKCDCFDILPDWVTLGYPLGFSDLGPIDFSTLDQWRGRNVHILGGNPHEQLEAVHKLTDPVATESQPANIVGIDGNIVQTYSSKFAKIWTEEKGIFRTDLTDRERVKISLQNVKEFWQKHGLWPDWSPSKDHGPIVRVPDEMVYMDSGAHIGKDIEQLDPAEIGMYPEVDDAPDVAAFESETRKKFVEWREGWVQHRHTNPDDTAESDAGEYQQVTLDSYPGRTRRK